MRIIFSVKFIRAFFAKVTLGIPIRDVQILKQINKLRF
jgi:hypothetical protein